MTTKISLSLISLVLVFSSSTTIAFAQQKLGEERNASACAAKSEGLIQRTSQLSSMVTTMLSKFDAISIRVQDFYQASGKTVSNYESLVNSSAQRRVEVLTSLEQAQSTMDAFSCDSDPRGQFNKYRQDMQKVKTSLANYRNSIRNLIVAVRPLGSDVSKKNEKLPRPTTQDSDLIRKMTPTPKPSSAGTRTR